MKILMIDVGGSSVKIDAAPAGSAAELQLVTTGLGGRSDLLGDMNSFVVHVSDAHGLDQQTSIRVDDSMDLGRAAQVALDEFVGTHGGNITFPVFIDIQLKKEFHNRAAMYVDAASAAPAR